MVDFNIFITFIFTIASVTNEKIPNVHTELHNDKDARQFTSLLQNIIKVNQGRMDSLKTLIKNQELPAYPQRFGRIMRTNLERDDEEDSSDRSEKGPRVVAYLVLPQVVPDVVFNYVEYSESRPRPNSVNRHWRNALPMAPVLRSCNSRAVKKCRKACRKALSYTCSTYSCKRQLRRYMKKECKLSCKDEFRSGYYRK